MNRQELRLVLMPGRKLLLLSAWLSRGVPRSTRHRGRAVWRCFLADVLDGCCFLICLTKYSFRLTLRFRQASFNSGFFRSICSAIGGLAELVGVAC